MLVECPRSGILFSKTRERYKQWELKVKMTKWLFLLAKIAKKEIIQPQRIKKQIKKEWS